MRLLVCLNNDLVANFALNLLWERIDHHDVSIALSKSIGPPSLPRADVFAKWGRLERSLVFDALFPSREKQDAPRTAYRTFRQLAASKGGAAPVFSNINHPEAVEYVRARRPDLIVAVRYGHIFKAPLFDIPRHGILNLHAGLLPQYRGIYCSFWAMLHKQPDVGCTLHHVRDAGIDTGDVIEEHRNRADYDRSVMWNLAMLYHGAADMIERAILAIEKGKALPSIPQSTEGGAYYRYPQNEDMAQLEQQGGRLYDRQDYETLFKFYGIDMSEELRRSFDGTTS